MCTHLSLGIYDLPAADWRVVRYLLRIHERPGLIDALIGLPKDGIEGLQCGCLPSESANDKGNLACTDQ